MFMKKVNLIIFASRLNKQGELRQAHEELFAVLDRHYDVNIVYPEEIGECDRKDFQMVFISSGGVEYMFRDYYAQLPRPVVLLTDGLQNSLAASLEINTWVRGQGIPCHIIHGSAAHVVAELEKAEKVYAMCNLLAGKRIGVIGEPSEWLIASGVNRESARLRWGVEFIDIPLEEVCSAFEDVMSAQVEDVSASIMSNATAVREPSVSEITKACRLYYALKHICSVHALDAFTIQCFGLIPRLKTTGCLALALLNDDGVPAGCEGDMQTIFTMLLAKELVGTPGFMCNPSCIDVSSNEIQLAHCTIGLHQCASYIVRDHFESHSGVAIQGHLPSGKYTLVKCGGPALDRFFVSSAVLLENTLSESVCRTQVRLRLQESCEYFLTNPIANHHVLVRGDYAGLFREFLGLV